MKNHTITHTFFPFILLFFPTHLLAECINITQLEIACTASSYSPQGVAVAVRDCIANSNMYGNGIDVNAELAVLVTNTFPGTNISSSSAWHMTKACGQTWKQTADAFLQSQSELFNWNLNPGANAIGFGDASLALEADYMPCSPSFSLVSSTRETFTRNPVTGTYVLTLFTSWGIREDFNSACSVAYVP